MSLALASAGYLVVLGLTGYEPQGMNEAVTSLLSHRPDALILTSSPADPAVRRRLRSAHVTVIETWDLPRVPVDLAIGFSDHRAGRALANFVFEQGYRRPLILTHGLARGRARMEGFLEQWRERQLEPPVCDIPHWRRLRSMAGSALAAFLDAAAGRMWWCAVRIVWPGRCSWRPTPAHCGFRRILPSSVLAPAIRPPWASCRADLGAHRWRRPSAGVPPRCCCCARRGGSLRSAVSISALRSSGAIAPERVTAAAPGCE